MNRILIIILMILTISVACNREIPSPVSNPAIPEFPPAPGSITAYTADGELLLMWSMPDSSEISLFRIYRADSANGQYDYNDSSVIEQYTARNLVNGRTYFFKVSAVDTGGIEGPASDVIHGTPNFFSIVINDGLESTSDRQVLLTMVAPDSTLLMRIANSPDLSRSPWQLFSDTKAWLLTSGDGEKTVYAIFRDSDGNITRDTLTDSIMLEVLPYQYALTVNDGAERTYSRDVDLVIGAPEGTSYMMISNESDFVNSPWEAYAPDRSWHISGASASNGDDVGFYALFRDSNGDSVSVMATDSIILACADAVDLYPVYQPEDMYAAISLEWSRSLSADFYAYRIFRSHGASPPDTGIVTLFDAVPSSFNDNLNIRDLPDDTPDSVFYMVRFYSVYADSSDSDPIAVTLVNNEPPALMTFISDINYDIDTLAGSSLQATFGWARSEIIDFDSYVVYENTDIDTMTATPLYYVYDHESLFYDIVKSDVDTLQVYYYWLRVFDLGGQSSPFTAPDSVYY